MLWRKHQGVGKVARELVEHVNRPGLYSAVKGLLKGLSSEVKRLP